MLILANTHLDRRTQHHVGCIAKPFRPKAENGCVSLIACFGDICVDFLETEKYNSFVYMYLHC